MQGTRKTNFLVHLKLYRKLKIKLASNKNTFIKRVPKKKKSLDPSVAPLIFETI